MISIFIASLQVMSSFRCLLRCNPMPDGGPCRARKWRLCSKRNCATMSICWPTPCWKWTRPSAKTPARVTENATKRRGAAFAKAFGRKTGSPCHAEGITIAVKKKALRVNKQFLKWKLFIADWSLIYVAIVVVLVLVLLILAVWSVVHLCRKGVLPCQARWCPKKSRRRLHRYSPLADPEAIRMSAKSIEIYYLKIILPLLVFLWFNSFE